MITQEVREQFIDTTMQNGSVKRYRQCPFCGERVSSKGFIVKKIPNGWFLYCHRCHDKLLIRNHRLSPNSVKRVMKDRQYSKEETLKKSRVLLPVDFTTEISTTGIAWLTKYGVTKNEIVTHRFGYSPKLDRVILPVFGESEILYWQGRRLNNDESIPKYLNVKSKSRNSIYFTINKHSDLTIIVEDILSALAVARAGYNACALLGSHVNDELVNIIHTKKVKVWLDPDMRKQSVKYSKRLRSFGLISSSILTPNKDPKEYRSSEIIKIISGEL